MPKKYTTSLTLIIVESPAKCKKIEEYLGPGYKCVASYGHLYTISGLNDIDIKNGYEPKYTIINEPIKKRQIEILRREIKNADEVILSSDADREGEMISYSLIKLFNLPLNTKRIIFHEITESAIKNAIMNPTTIDMNKVYSQQARQILDLLVGFKISPLLWKYLVKNKQNSLSAGRCQTPALKLIYDNDNEKENEEKKVYNTIGYFTNGNIAFELNKQYESEKEMIDFLDGSADHKHIYTCSLPTKVIKKQPEPFTTSKIQQKASNEFHYSPKETMRICQNLYEAGYITYMRTDSKTYSDEFIESCKVYIQRNFDIKYISSEIDKLSNKKDKIENNVNDKKDKKQKNNLAQEAHEAIRPTKINQKDLPENIDSKERKMYRLIWENTLESCMSPAEYYSITASISGYNDVKFKYTSEKIDFAGWKIVSNKLSTLNEDKEFIYLQSLNQNIIYPYKKIVSRVTIKNLKSHYTEARLVQLLEEKGIGRPSTFSSIIDKIQERGYVKKQDINGKEIICNDFELENDEISEIEYKKIFGNEKNKLVIQPLGIIVIEFLEKYFSQLFNYDFTREMENSLDKISKGELVWNNICINCDEQINISTNNLEKQNKSKMEIKIDNENIFLIGKYGPVIKNIEIDEQGKEMVSFKPVKNDINMEKLENNEYNIEDIVDNTKNKIKNINKINLGKYPENGKDVILNKGKFGLYVEWENSISLKTFGNRPIESITLEEVIPFLNNKTNSILREISNNISVRKGSKGNYIFFKTIKMKKPQFYSLNEFKEDYLNCNISIIKDWIKDKFNIT